MEEIKIGNQIYHKRYGQCTVENINEIGVVIMPGTILGQLKLFEDSEKYLVPLLEDDLTQIIELKNPV